MPDLDKADKIKRAWKRLIQAFLEGSPPEVLNPLKEQYENLIVHLTTWTEIETQAKNYSLHYQSGRTVLIHNNSMMFTKLKSECIKAEYEIEKEKSLTINRDRILQERAKHNLD